MKNMKKLSILLASTMVFNIFAFPSLAEASTLDKNTVYSSQPDTDVYKTQLDTRAPEAKAQTVLDIGKGSINITENSVTGFTPSGAPATVNPNGYEITGTTTANNITVSNTSNTPQLITIRNVNINYTDDIPYAIQTDYTHLTVLGTNTINSAKRSGTGALIGAKQSSTLRIQGNGILNITDNSSTSDTIGILGTLASIFIEGDVVINARRTNPKNEGYVIGGNNARYYNTITISGNAKVNATIDGVSTRAVIGMARGEIVTVRITDNAQVIATGGTGETIAPVIGGDRLSVLKTHVFIEDSAYVKVIPRSTYTGPLDTTGMGFPVNATMQPQGLGRTSINIAPTANVEAPTRENYYSTVGTGRNLGHRITTRGLAPSTVVPMIYDGTTTSVLTDPKGIIYSYLPLGAQSINIAGSPFTGTVELDGTAKFVQQKDGQKPILDISKASINMTYTTVDAQTPEGKPASFDIDGYEIVGSTTTNTITNLVAAPTVLNGITINGPSTAIDMTSGGEIALKGTNTITRDSQYTGPRALIEQTSDTIHFAGTGTLNITDKATVAATIGENNGNQTVGVDVKSGVNINIDKNGSGAAIGTTNAGTTGRANITIEDGARVNISNASTAKATNSAGMGLPAGAPITSAMIARTTAKISPRANLEAPARENYYKDLAGTTAVYKAAVAGLDPNANVSVVYGGKTANTSTFADGGLYLYLPVGAQVATVNGEKFEGVVEDSQSNKMFIKTILTAADMSAHVTDGAVGINLRGHEQTTSPAGIRKYTIKDAGNTGATVTKTTLNWNKLGTIIMNVSQAESGKYSQASTDFTVTLTSDPDDIEVSVSVDVASIGFGNIAVIDQNNKEIVPFVKPGESIALKAVPDQGYELEKWVKTTTTTTRAVTTETLPGTPRLDIVANANESYTAFFKAQKAIPGPKLANIEVSAKSIQPNGTLKEENKPLIHQDVTEGTLFNPDKLEYGLYLRSIDTNDINIYLRHNDTGRIDIKVGDGQEVVVPIFEQYQVSLKLDGSAYQEIPIAVRRGTETTTYVIKVFKNQKAENDPHVYAELEINPVKEVLELGIYAMNVDVNAFEMTIKIDELLSADKKAFEAFVNNKGVAFTAKDLGTNLAGDLANYFNLDPKFELAKMTSDGEFISFTVNARPVWGAIHIGSTPRKILSINVKRSDAYKGTLTKQIDTLQIKPVVKGNATYGNNLSSKFYGGLNDTFQANTAADEKTLAYLVFRAKEDIVKIFVAFNANSVDRVSYKIEDVSDPNKKIIVAQGPVVNNEIQESIIQSTYRISILANGYLLAESQDIVYAGAPSEYGIIITPVQLLEGDLDANQKIDSADRTMLITVLNKKVANKGSGFVTVGNEKIYADYNNDNRINSLDLGKLVQNIGKEYAPITQQK